jgi:molecular chaperone GrpE
MAGQIRNPMIQEPMNEEEAVKAEGTTAEGETSTEGTAQDAPAEDQTTRDAGSDAPSEEGSEADSPDEWKEKYLRLYADFDNYRKRNMRERGDLVRHAGRDLMEALLPVLDDFERAWAAGEGQEAGQAREGYQLIGQKLRGILEAKGLNRMEAKEAEFDTDLHEAITQIPAPSEDLKGKVVDVVEPGYKLHDTVLRFAKVVVGN